MNSVLQCLSNTSSLKNSMLLNNYYKNNESKLLQKGDIIHEFSKVIKNLWFGSKKYYIPYTFLKSFIK